MKVIIAAFLCVFIAGCNITPESYASSDGAASAKSYIEGGGCSKYRTAMGYELYRLKKEGRSVEYITKFALARDSACDEHYRVVRARAEMCAQRHPFCSLATLQQLNKKKEGS